MSKRLFWFSIVVIFSSVIVIGFLEKYQPLPCNNYLADKAEATTGLESNFTTVGEIQQFSNGVQIQVIRDVRTRQKYAIVSSSNGCEMIFLER